MTRRANKQQKAAPAAAQPPPASDRVRGEWMRRVEAEYRSAAITQHLTLWLIQIGAPPQLIRDGLRIVDDELVHAELSHQVYAHVGGVGTPRLDRDGLQFARRQVPLEQDVLRCGLQVFCLGETAAVRLFSRLRESCRVAPARKALDRILRDEVRHKDFGWTLLEWMLQGEGADEIRKSVEHELPAMLAALLKNYGDVAGTEQDARPPTPLSDEDRVWGLMDASDYAEAVQLCMQRDYAPLFEGLGISPMVNQGRK